MALDTLTPGDRARFVRVSDSDPALLRELAELGIAPGDEVVAGHIRAELAAVMRVVA